MSESKAVRSGYASCGFFTPTIGSAPASVAYYEVRCRKGARFELRRPGSAALLHVYVGPCSWASISPGFDLEATTESGLEWRSEDPTAEVEFFTRLEIANSDAYRTVTPEEFAHLRVPGREEDARFRAEAERCASEALSTMLLGPKEDRLPGAFAEFDFNEPTPRRQRVETTALMIRDRLREVLGVGEVLVDVLSPGRFDAVLSAPDGGSVSKEVLDYARSLVPWIVPATVAVFVRNVGDDYADAAKAACLAAEDRNSSSAPETKRSAVAKIAKGHAGYSVTVSNDAREVFRGVAKALDELKAKAAEVSMLSLGRLERLVYDGIETPVSFDARTERAKAAHLADFDRKRETDRRK